MCESVFMATKNEQKMIYVCTNNCNCRIKLVVCFHKNFTCDTLWRNTYIWNNNCIEFDKSIYFMPVFILVWFSFASSISFFIYRFVSYQLTTIDWFLCFFRIFMATAHSWMVISSWTTWSYLISIFRCCFSLLAITVMS